MGAALWAAAGALAHPGRQTPWGMGVGEGEGWWMVPRPEKPSAPGARGGVGGRGAALPEQLLKEQMWHFPRGMLLSLSTVGWSRDLGSRGSYGQRWPAIHSHLLVLGRQNAPGTELAQAAGTRCPPACPTGPGSPPTHAPSGCSGDLILPAQGAAARRGP